MGNRFPCTGVQPDRGVTSPGHVGPLGRDGAVVIGGGPGTTVHLWDHAADEVVTLDVEQSPWVVELDPAGGVLFVSGPDGFAAWDVATATRAAVTFQR